MNRDDIAAGEYQRQLGAEALKRQEQLARDLHRCCGEWKDGPHHEACKHYTPELPTVSPDQETLL